MDRQQEEWKGLKFIVFKELYVLLLVAMIFLHHGGTAKISNYGNQESRKAN